VALLGTGLATIALGVLAYDLSAERADLVLGTILTIKMVAMSASLRLQAPLPTADYAARCWSAFI
jgi:hypothetical protein